MQLFQQRNEPRVLSNRIDAWIDTYHAVRMIIDSAARAGLPARPIEDKALEAVASCAVKTRTADTITSCVARPPPSPLSPGASALALRASSPEEER